MSLLSRLERRLETAVEGVFTRRGGQGVHPVEIARRLARAMESGRQVGVSHVFTPNVYAVFLNPADFAPFASWIPALVRELSTYLAAQIEEAGYRLPGPLRVTVEARDEVAPAQILVQSALEAAEAAPAPVEFPADETKRFPPVKVQAELLVRRGSDSVRIVPLPAEGLTIGRRDDCGLILVDRKVSRTHARIEVGPQGHLLVDLQSSNGTLVNGRRVEQTRLAEGDEIVIGETTLLYRVARESSQPPDRG